MSRIVIPISDNQQITVVRTEATSTDKGVIWRGTVEDTGESAVLQWWKDGRLTGEFGHKGHIFTVMNMGGDLHAVLEIDPKMMPPDHPSSSEHRSSPGKWTWPFGAADPPPCLRSSRFLLRSSRRWRRRRSSSM